MASGTSFKQQCPSCETMVPVRDTSLIGRKIDCPKCKYRFLVEAPEEAEPEDEKPVKKDKAAAVKAVKAAGKSASAKAGAGKDKARKSDPDDEEAPKPRKKKQAAGGSNMLIIGIGVAAVALVAIGVGLFFAFSGGGSSPGSGSSTSPSAPPSGAPAGVAADPTAGQGGAGPSGTPAPPAPVELVNITNLLPNDTHALVSYPMGATLGSLLRTAAIDEAEGGYRLEKFQSLFGFGIGDLNHVVTGMNAKDRWVFSILQTKNPFNPQLITAQLALQAQPSVRSKSGRMYDYFLIKNDLDSLGNLLLKFNQPRETYAVHFLDPTTMVFADPQPLRRFLEDDCRPKILSAEPVAPAPDGPAAGGPPGMAGGPPGMAGGPPGMAGGPPGMAGGPGAGAPMPLSPGGGPGAGSPMPMAPGGPGGRPQGGRGEDGRGEGGRGGVAGGTGQLPPAMPSGSWLSVEPSLKVLLDRIEKHEENQQTRQKQAVSPVTFVTLVQPVQGTYLPWAREQIDRLPVLGASLVYAGIMGRIDVNRAETVGVSLQAFNQNNAVVALGMGLRERRDLDPTARRIREGMPLALPIIKEALGLNVTLAQPSAGGDTPGGTGLGGPGEGMLGQGGRPGFPGPAGMPSPGGPAGVSSGGSGPRGGGSSPPGGIPGGPAGVGMGGRPGTPGVPPMPGMGGPGFPGFPGGGTGGTAPTTPEDSDGSFDLAVEDKLLVCTLDLKLSQDAREKLVDVARDGATWLKSQSDQVAVRSRTHDLARALKAYFDEKGTFPPGLMARAPSAERGIPWRPDQRLSWVAALLPYLGQEYRDWKVDENKSWNEGKNLSVAGRVVTPLVDPRNHGLSPVYVRFPGQDTPVAVTHFVAVAGLGMDAPEYNLTDPAVAKKVGLFGYDRTVKRQDVKDGMDKTIAFLMVPGVHAAPWLAGGGATLRGILEESDEQKPLSVYTCCVYPGKPDKDFDGKRGTLAIMADGRVRFLPETLDPAMFRAMCTIAGEEKIERLDRLCPVIDAPEGSELKADPTLQRPPTPVPATPTVKVDWKDYTPASKVFSAKFPGEVSEAPVQAKLPTGADLNMTVWTSKFGSTDAMCAVSTFDLPLTDAQADQALAQAGTGIVQLAGAGAKISKESKITLGTSPGRALTITTGKGTVYARVYFIGGKLFQLTAGAVPPMSEKDATTFFDSFKPGS